MGLHLLRAVILGAYKAPRQIVWISGVAFFLLMPLFIVTGDLTIHGVTHSVDVKFELLGVSQDPWGNTRIGFEGKAEISRKEFGLVWNVALETGGVLVGDTIKLELDIEAVKQA